MLTPEQAREQLQSFKVADARKRRAKRLRSLPASARKHLEYLTDERALNKMGMLDMWRADIRLGAFLDGLAPAKRLAVFEALQPSLASSFERLWCATVGWPYQASWSRKAFRAPNTPELTWPARVARVRTIVRILDDFEPDIVWVATWAAHLSVYGAGLEVGSFLAGAIDEPDGKADEVFDILCASVRGDHEIGVMGRHVVQAFVASFRQDGWEVVERMLLGAQREEGLRQVILECADLAHPIAFRRVLRLILEHDLARFSAVTYTLNLWLGYQWDSASVQVVNVTISRLLTLLDDTDAREKTLAGDDAEAVYLALWCYALEDAIAVVPRAVEVLGAPDESRRFVAARLLAQLEHSVAQEALVPVVDDPDIRVATQAIYAFSDEVIATVAAPGLFDRIAQFVERLPKRKTTTKPLVWPWGTFTIDRYSGGSALLNSLGDRPITQIIPHLSALNPARRNEVAERLTKLRSWDAQCREALVTLCGDSSASVRATAIDAIGVRPVAEQDARALEKLLTRRAEDLRRAVLKVLAGQAERAALASTKRLLASDEEVQRLGGLELLRLLHEAGRDRRAVRKHLDGFRAARELTAAEQHIVGLLEEDRPSAVTLDNALGLMDFSRRGRTAPPRPLKVVWATDAARECLKSLDACVHEHREATITIKGYDDREQSVLLGSVTWGFPSVFQGQCVADIDTLPLRELWEAWWQHRPATQRDADGYELIRAVASLEGAFSGSLPHGHSGLQKLLRRFLARGAEDSSLRYDQIVGNVVWWLLRLHPPDGATDFLLDAIEASFAAVPDEVLARKVDPEKWDDPDWRNQSPFVAWVAIARNWQGIQPDRWSPERHARLWRLLRWADEPGTGVQRNRAQMEEVVEAFEAGAATEADLYDQLLGLRPQGRWQGDFNDLRRLTKRTPPSELKRCAALAHAVEACRKRILDIELDRGEPATPATQPASSLSYIEGTETLVRILTRLGRGKLVRSSFQESRSGVFSHLIRVCCPAETDTPEAFATQARTAGIGEQRLIELAAFAPQWAACVEHALGAPGLADGAWWIHAHTKDDQWHVEQEIREIWKAEASRRTPLTGADLIDGAVDVGWFRRVFEQLGADRWATLAECAKYASDGTGHARAKLFAEAMLGRVAKDELVRRINEKRNKDAARALGLLPLAEGKAGQADLLDRYERLHAFLRTSRKYGAQRRASEKRATEIGLENLARTAG